MPTEENTTSKQTKTGEQTKNKTRREQQNSKNQRKRETTNKNKTQIKQNKTKHKQNEKKETTKTTSKNKTQTTTTTKQNKQKTALAPLPCEGLTSLKEGLEEGIWDNGQARGVLLPRNSYFGGVFFPCGSFSFVLSHEKPCKEALKKPLIQAQKGIFLTRFPIEAALKRNKHETAIWPFLFCLVISFLGAMVLHSLSCLVVKCFMKWMSMQHLFGDRNKKEMATLGVHF